MRLQTWCLALLVCSWSTAAYGQVERDDHSIVFELGAAGDWERGEAIHSGGTFAFEVTPIEHWLELEFGVTALAADHGTEVPFDVIFKKPWQPSSKFEFMVGVGPEVAKGSFGVEGVLDFMFWPSKNVGWYVEPGYEVTWHDGAQHRGLGIAFGLLLGK